MSPARKAAQIRAYLDQRIAYALEWYDECDVCSETLENVKKDLDSVLEETCRKFHIDRMPFLLAASFDHDIIVVRTINRSLS